MTQMESLFPRQALRPRWSSASFLFYAGMVVLLVATVALVAALARTTGGGAGSATGWSAVVLGVTVAVALLLRGRGQAVPAGLAAFLAVVLAGTFVGALTDWVGIAPETSALQRSFEPGLYLVEATVVAAGLLALRAFRFPLLVLPVAATLLFAFVDICTTIVDASGDGVPAVFAAAGGAALASVGVALDRADRAAYALWPHAVGGVGIGIGLLALRTHGDPGWLAVSAGALAFVAAAALLRRSSWAVLGAVGVLVAATHWIGKWVGIGGLVPFLGGSRPEPWEIALAYVVVGVVIALLGMLVERRG